MPRVNDSAADPWQHPDISLLGSGRRAAPRFPTPLLKDFWAEWVARSAETTSAPADYVAVSLLCNASAMIANARWPLAGADWKEPPIIWAALVGSPSSGKSPALDVALEVLRESEDRMADGFDEKRRSWEIQSATAQAYRAAWEDAVKKAVKHGDTPPELPSEANMPESIERPRIRVADATSEAMGKLASSHDRGLLLVRDELSGWLGGFDRYAAGGGADRAFSIEMYGGRSYIIDRAKSPEPLRIPHLSVSVIGGIQPDKLSALIKGPDDGLLARFLWTWPDALVGFSLARTVANHSAAKTAFGRLLDLQMAINEAGKPTPAAVKLTEDAEDELEEFARQMQLLGGDAYGPYASTVGKARGHVLRLAGVLEYLWWSGSPVAAEPTAISADAVLAASALVADYFLPMAARVFGDASIPEVERNAMVLAKYLRKMRLPNFNARSLRRELSGPFRQASAMDAACEALKEAGLIRPKVTGGKGRHPKEFEVHPVVFGDAV